MGQWIYEGEVVTAGKKIRGGHEKKTRPLVATNPVFRLLITG